MLPIAFVFVSYLQHQKDLSDKALALGVVKDPKVSRRSSCAGCRSQSLHFGHCRPPPSFFCRLPHSSFAIVCAPLCSVSRDER